MAFGQDIADQLVTARTQQAMVNSLEYKTLEDQARSQHEAAVNATLAWDARDNAGNEPYQTDGYAQVPHRLILLTRCGILPRLKTQRTLTMRTLLQTSQTTPIGWLLSRDGPLSPNHRDSTSKNWNLGRSCSLMRRSSLLHNVPVVAPRPASSFLR